MAKIAPRLAARSASKLHVDLDHLDLARVCRFDDELGAMDSPQRVRAVAGRDVPAVLIFALDLAWAAGGRVVDRFPLSLGRARRSAFAQAPSPMRAII